MVAESFLKIWLSETLKRAGYNEDLVFEKPKKGKKKTEAGRNCGSIPPIH